jgi:hypothetical protein
MENLTLVLLKYFTSASARPRWQAAGFELAGARSPATAS